MWSLYGIRYNRCGSKSKGSANKYIPIVGGLGTCQRLISEIQVMEKSSAEDIHLVRSLVGLKPKANAGMF